MIYVFDNSPLSVLFKNYYRQIFRSLWDRFDAIVDEGRLLSTREVLHEINDGPLEALRIWAKNHKDIFTTPTVEEGDFVSKIFSIPHFRQNIEQQKYYKGGYNADPFVVAKAAVINGTVVTLERHRPNAAKIPNICEHFDIYCISLEEFMERERWEF